MDFLKRIDWNNHDGVNLGMINDFVRNQFYDRVISRYVQDQDCTDIGFGTGLLSMLALKHGARHIRAFESDTDRYQLGCEIIKQLGLHNRIELLNEQYDHYYQPTPITFTETVLLVAV
jgi:predicted RNA methylase